MPDEALTPGRGDIGPAPAPPEKKHMFGGPKPAPGLSPEVSGMIEQMNALAARLRISEERFSELRKRLHFIEQNMMTNHKQALHEIKTSGSEIDELRHKLEDVADRVITIIKELRLTARKNDIDVIKRYIELWDPVKFVTAEYAEKIARDVFEELRKE